MTMFAPSAFHSFSYTVLNDVGTSTTGVFISFSRNFARNSLISDGFTNITTLPYQILPPIIVLALLMLAFNFVGDGVREALAPRIEDM